MDAPAGDARPMSDQPDTRRTPHRPRVIVVDADRRVRDGLTGLLACDASVELAGSAAHADAALALTTGTRPDALVIDPRLPEATDGIALIERLRARMPELRVVVLAWSSALERALGGDPHVSVVSPSAGPADLVESIHALVAAPAVADQPGPGARIRRSA
jgi:DNA-binding NarL/FixJ family response regulator